MLTDNLVEELLAQAPDEAKRPTMGNIKKLRYTHEAMVDLIIQHPEISQNHLAALFGYTPSWVSNVMASDAFQEQLAKRRTEICDPILRATLEERTRALYLQSLAVLQQKLDSPEVSADVAIKAAELGARSLGLGQAKQAPEVGGTDRLKLLAARLIELNPNSRGGNYEIQVIEAESAAPASL